jgi:uncharacterized protein YfiM (DUF2279 family)
MDKIRLPTIALALLLLTSPAQASGLGNDKAMHITASTAAGIVLAQNKPFCLWQPWQRVLFNVAIIGGGKEWYDSRHPNNHSADWGDIAADAVGTFGAEGGGYWDIYSC